VVPNHRQVAYFFVKLVPGQPALCGIERARVRFRTAAVRNVRVSPRSHGAATLRDANGLSAACGLVRVMPCPRRQEAPATARLDLREGQSATVAGTDLTVTALKVADLFAAGCRGGALGCPNTAELRVARGTTSS
jgi:hypothetical protein